MINTGELIGRIFDNRYKITELIGRGGMGAVYKALHISMNQIVAIKVLGKTFTLDERQVQRFYQEARASSRLRHPNSIKVYDFGRSEEGHLYIVMEFLEGETLGQLLKKEKVLPVRRACNIIKQVLKSLGEAHQIGLIHRDLKPENIFITKIYGEEDFIKVLDFGIAKFLEGTPDHESLTQAGLVCGTPAYISPEQALGRTLDPSADLYSVGIIFYEMLVGRPPFKAETSISLVMKHIHESPPPMKTFNPDLVTPTKLEKLIFKLIEKDKNKRFFSTKEVIDIIDEVLLEGGFPEIPSKKVIEVPLPSPPLVSQEASETRVERKKLEIPPEEVDHEEKTRFLPQSDKEGLSIPDSEAPTTFLQQEEVFEVEPSPILPSYEIAKKEIEVAKVLKKPTSHFISSAIEREKRRKWVWIFISAIAFVLLLSSSTVFILKHKSPEELPIKYVPPSNVDLKINLSKPVKKIELPSISAPSKDVSKEVKEKKIKTITIQTVPEGATIFLGEEKIGVTPYKMEIKDETGIKLLNIKKTGFENLVWELNAQEILKDDKHEYSFNLQEIKPKPEIKKVQKPVQEIKAKPKPSVKKKVEKKIEWEDF